MKLPYGPTTVEKVKREEPGALEDALAALASSWVKADELHPAVLVYVGAARRERLLSSAERTIAEAAAVIAALKNAAS